jgi:hypothetical protein
MLSERQAAGPSANRLVAGSTGRPCLIELIDIAFVKTSRIDRALRPGLRILRLVGRADPVLGSQRQTALRCDSVSGRRAAARCRAGAQAARVLAPGPIRGRGPFGRRGGCAPAQVPAARSCDRKAGRNLAVSDRSLLSLRGRTTDPFRQDLAPPGPHPVRLTLQSERCCLSGGESKSSSGPAGTILVGLIAGWVR